MENSENMEDIICQLDSDWKSIFNNIKKKYRDSVDSESLYDYIKNLFLDYMQESSIWCNTEFYNNLINDNIIFRANNIGKYFDEILDDLDDDQLRNEFNQWIDYIINNIDYINY